MDARGVDRGRDPVLVRWKAGLLGLGGLGSLALLLAHAWQYAFLTDDAYISSRYAVNQAEGQGLVFNPGERVEGYTNFLWVVVLAAFAFAGMPPEVVALPLSAAATTGLWAVTAWWALRSSPSGAARGWALAPLLLLATNRTVAVWSSGGLETRLFELLVVAAVLAVATRLVARRDPRTFLLPASLFALATLTRPDALLITVSCAAVALGVLRHRDASLRPLLIGAGLYVAIVGSHLTFRRLYYGDWLPNTYYAKVGGQDWDGEGFLYLEAFLLEYAALLWAFPLALAVLGHWRRRTLVVPALLGAAIVPHAAYYVSIGGDHFEYRRFGLYLPLLFLLIGDGLRTAGGRPLRSTVAALYLLTMVAAGSLVPYLSHVGFPTSYHPGFPGGCGHEFGDWVDVETSPLRWVPGLQWTLDHWRPRMWSLSRRFIGLRQEEHAAFVATVEPEGLLLASAMEAGLLRPDSHVAIDSVGAIPYFSGMGSSTATD